MTAYRTGSYVLELRLAAPASLWVGRLGTVTIPAGRVRYFGSARGSGGVAARVARHLRVDKKKHWHIDYLTARWPSKSVFVDVERTECELVAEDLRDGKWTVVVDGFGSSDCRTCPAHPLWKKH